jgi:hypothetical protein
MATSVAAHVAAPVVSAIALSTPACVLAIIAVLAVIAVLALVFLLTVVLTVLFTVDITEYFVRTILLIVMAMDHAGLLGTSVTLFVGRITTFAFLLFFILAAISAIMIIIPVSIELVCSLRSKVLFFELTSCPNHPYV